MHLAPETGSPESEVNEAGSALPPANIFRIIFRKNLKSQPRRIVQYKLRLPPLHALKLIAGGHWLTAVCFPCYFHSFNASRSRLTTRS